MSKSVILTVLLVLATLGRAAAQAVTAEVSFELEHFLPGETIVAAVKITNQSGQQLHFGDSAGWLEFAVEAMDGTVIRHLADPVVAGAFDLQSSEIGVKHVEISPCFDLKHTGRYKLTVTVHIRDWATAVQSKPAEFDVIHGAKIWEQTFGLPGTAGRSPEVRKYVLNEANYLRDQIRLYLCVQDESDTTIYRVLALGPMVAFGQPETLLDGSQRLHILWQSGSSVYGYRVVTPEGVVVEQAVYDYVGSRPRLNVDEHGGISVVGGAPRLRSADMPSVRSPVDLSPAGSR